VSLKKCILNTGKEKAWKTDKQKMKDNIRMSNGSRLVCGTGSESYQTESLIMSSVESFG
jgi:hypothetical protein